MGLVVGLGILCTPTTGLARKRDGTDPLPLHRLRLYETGVGYFERRGRVTRGSAQLPLPAAHLDDAIKSLVILQPPGQDSGPKGAARVAGVSFPSAFGQGMARAMAGLPPTEDGDPIDHQSLLRSLVGLTVTGRTQAGPVRGQVVEVLGPFARPQPKAAQDDDGGERPDPTPVYAVLLVTDDGRVRRISTDELIELGPRDAAQGRRIQAAATALSESAARRTESLRVELARGGTIGVGYVAETPVWRTSYRVTLPGEGTRGTLQAWALVHNDTDEDWDDVVLEFVNGEPTSFLFPLAAPRYERRELRQPDRPLSTVPQLARHTVDAMYGDLDADPFGRGVGGLGLVGHGRGGGAGFGGRGKRVPRRSWEEPIPMDDADTWGDLAQHSQARTEPAGALFHYRLADAVDLPARSSALVPLVQSAIEAQTITLVPPGEDAGLTAARVVNDTQQTLPAGTIAFFGQGGFAGEAELPRLKPTERAFVTYGHELDVEVDRRRDAVQDVTLAVEFRDNQLVERREVRYTLVVDVANRDAAPRQVYVGLPLPERAEIKGASQLDYDDSRSEALLVVQVPGRQTVQQRLAITQRESRKRTAAKITQPELRRLASATGVPEEDRKRLRRAASLKKTAAQARAQAAELEVAIETAKEDLGRLRENLSAMRNTGATDRAARALARRILDTEERIATHRIALGNLEGRAKRLDERISLVLRQLPSG